MEQLKPKLFYVLRNYSKEQFIKDIVAGIIVAIIALPLSIALALASGVSPEKGLYTAIVAGFVISFLGGSRVQISGPTAAFATIVAGIVATSGLEGLAVATVMAGLLLILMGVLRLGNLIRFIPYTITTGFTAGIAVTIVGTTTNKCCCCKEQRKNYFFHSYCFRLVYKYVILPQIYIFYPKMLP